MTVCLDTNVLLQIFAPEEFIGKFLQV